MKAKFTFIILFLLFFIIDSNAQCNIENILPIKLGITRLNTINIINGDQNITNIEINEHNSFWIYRDASKKDSILKAVIIFNINNRICLDGDKNFVELYFANDILYKITIQSYFIPKEVNRCLLSFNKFTNTLKNNYVTSIPFFHFKIKNASKYSWNTSRLYFSKAYKGNINDDPKLVGRIGEGYLFYNKEDDISEKVSKKSYTEVSYRFGMPEWDSSESYIIEFSTINLNVTQYDSSWNL